MSCLTYKPTQENKVQQKKLIVHNSNSKMVFEQDSLYNHIYTLWRLWIICYLPLWFAFATLVLLSNIVDFIELILIRWIGNITFLCFYRLSHEKTELWNDCIMKRLSYENKNRHLGDRSAKKVSVLDPQLFLSSSKLSWVLISESDSNTECYWLCSLQWFCVTIMSNRSTAFSRS